MLDNKGQIHTVEAFLAILLLFSALSIAALFAPSTDNDDHNSLVNVGMQVLTAADVEGELGGLIDKGNWTTLEETLNALLPLGTTHNLTVYDVTMQPLNDIPISNGMLPSQEVASVQYPCVSPSLQTRCYLLRLQLARAR